MWIISDELAGKLQDSLRGSENVGTFTIDVREDQPPTNDEIEAALRRAIRDSQSIADRDAAVRSLAIFLDAVKNTSEPSDELSQRFEKTMAVIDETRERLNQYASKVDKILAVSADGKVFCSSPSGWKFEPGKKAETCGTCRFWQRSSVTISGVCEKQSNRLGRTFTVESGHCGLYERKTEPCPEPIDQGEKLCRTCSEWSPTINFYEGRLFDGWCNDHRFAKNSTSDSCRCYSPKVEGSND